MDSLKNVTTNELLSFSGFKNVPLIIQSEISECGLACIAMIASYHGYRVNISSLRNRSKFGSQGINLKQLIDVSNSLNFNTRALQCELNEVNQLKMPCIIHWNLDHYVVLVKIKRNQYIINDPALGKIKLNTDQFSKSFTGICLELTPSTNFEKKNIIPVMKINQLWESAIGIKREITSLIFISLIIQIMIIISPYYMQWIIDDVLVSNDVSLLILLVIGFSFIKFFEITIDSIRSWMVTKLSSSLNMQMGANVFNHLLKLPISYFHRRHIGDVLSRFRSIYKIKDLISHGIIESFVDILMVILILIMMLIYSTELTSFVFLMLFISTLIRICFFSSNRRRVEEAISLSAKEETTFIESIKAIQTIKLFGNESYRANIWVNTYADHINSEISLAKVSLCESYLVRITLGFEFILTVFLGSKLVIDQQLTTGMLLAFLAYKNIFISCSISIIEHIFSFKLLSVDLERISDITLEMREDHTSNKESLPSITGHIKVDNVWFRYSSSTEWIIKGLSLEIQSGEFVAITGKSGCGKSTLLKLLLGIEKPTKGKIYIDGIDISKIDLTHYRNSIACVMQNDTILSGTISDNITMFSPEIDYTKRNLCCENAAILEDIQLLPMGFNTLLNESGSVLSGGQLQRLYLARAIYKDPKILFLDESTSHLDISNESDINKNISKLNITRISIAHRKETIEIADRVINLAR
ncbi:peptidase domain-containing ABC transporter [Vibrio cholerae]|nr:peptidase domain-containing ABC transporter [Vibrio cholerae]